MSKLLEHIIRRALFEQTDDWDITIEFSQPDGEGPGRVLRYQTAQDNAEKVGAIAGVAVLAKARRGEKNPTSNISEIIKEIVQMMESNPGHVYGPSGKYDSRKYIYVLATVKSKPKRKVFNLMVFDRTPLQAVADMLTDDNYIGQSFAGSTDNVIGSRINVLSDDQFVAYITRLKKAVKDIDNVNVDKIWNNSGIEKINLSAMRSSIKDTEHETDVEAVGVKKQMSFYKDNIMIFAGEVITVFDPKFQEIAFKAIQGKARLERPGKLDIFEFDGEFEDGAPINGTLKLEKRNGNLKTSWQLNSFKGTIKNNSWIVGGADVISPGMKTKSARLVSIQSMETDTLRLIEAEESVYDIGLTYKGTYDDNSVFDTGVLTQTVDPKVTSDVAGSRYTDFNLTKLLIDNFEIGTFNIGTNEEPKKVKINTLPKTHISRLIIKLVVAK